MAIFGEVRPELNVFELVYLICVQRCDSVKSAVVCVSIPFPFLIQKLVFMVLGDIYGVPYWGENVPQYAAVVNIASPYIGEGNPIFSSLLCKHHRIAQALENKGFAYLSSHVVPAGTGRSFRR